MQLWLCCIIKRSKNTHKGGVTVDSNATLNDTHTNTRTLQDWMYLSMKRGKKSWITIAHCVMCMNQECFRSLEVINLRSHTERLETDIRLTS